MVLGTQPHATESVHLFLEVNVPPKNQIKDRHTKKRSKLSYLLIFLHVSMTGLVIYKVSSDAYLLDYSTQVE